MIRKNFLMVMAFIVLFGCGSQPTKNAQPNSNGMTNASSRPNILFILTDDMDLSGLEFMPKLKKYITDEGTQFSNFIISMALCCPSRVCILRGQYPHNTQIIANKPPRGGFERFYEMGGEQSTIAVWLQQKGYRTALFGKYLNGYPYADMLDYIPPGWDEWYSPVKGGAYRQFNYTLNENGKLIKYGSHPKDYGTDVYLRKATQFMKKAIEDKQSFFAFVSLYAPHTPTTAAPRHENLFQDLQLPLSPNFNEEDVTDKPIAIQELPRLTKKQISELEEEYRKRARSLQAVDEMVESFVKFLDEEDQLNNTYIVFTSDNGYHLGQHRLMQGKNSPYEEDIRVPLIIRGPNVKKGQIVNKVVGNIDLAPTFAEIGGANIPDFVDGISLLPLLEGNEGIDWREAYLLQKGDPYNRIYHGVGKKDSKGRGEEIRVPLDYDNVLEPPDSPYYDYYMDKAFGGMPYYGIRTMQYTYIEYEGGEKELYDLIADPYQLHNIASTADSALLNKLSGLVNRLKNCAGKSCRE